jgi:hypothetical protein
VFGFCGSAIQCGNNAIPALSPFRGVHITGGGRAEPCLRRVFRDLVGLGFQWILHLYSVDAHGLRSFYRALLAFSSPGR